MRNRPVPNWISTKGGRERESERERGILRTRLIKIFTLIEASQGWINMQVTAQVCCARVNSCYVVNRSINQLIGID